jgi:Putative stress-induced transcription regulator
MRLAKKYSVPQEIAVLYEFLNSTDQRQYLEKGQQHVPSDHLASAAQLEAWMRGAGLLAKGQRITANDHQLALGLRAAIRSFLQMPPESRSTPNSFVDRLNKLSEFYPLVVRNIDSGSLVLQPAAGTNALGIVLAELFSLARAAAAAGLILLLIAILPANVHAARAEVTFAASLRRRSLYAFRCSVDPWWYSRFSGGKR